MEWGSFLIGYWLGAMCGVFLLAMLQIVRERREWGGADLDEMDWVDALSGQDEAVRRLGEQNSRRVKQMIEREGQ
jgi:hypothetical protein